ncbi:MAG: mannose-6-phosphate isomerase, class I [Saprospiraceae bacterium]
MDTAAVFPLQGVVQHYAWGGTEYLPQLLHLSNNDAIPFAEYWLGIHPKGTATVMLPNTHEPLSAFLASRPAMLGSSTLATFGTLPFLFKVLDVASMLSIQLHPTIEVAKAGYARENAAGIPLNADHRNYKDTNHKPEVMVALTDFWLLHGFRSAETIRETLLRFTAWQPLLPILEKNGVAALYAHVMQIPQSEVDTLLQPVLATIQDTPNAADPHHPDHWAAKAFSEYTTNGHHDRGIFSIYWFNLVYLQPGQGIFQGAGIPHAYLKGINIELMSNSDNVLRGGLTPKHIDVPELLANINTETVVPQILPHAPDADGVANYPVPVDDFALTRYDIPVGQARAILHQAPSIWLVMEGSIQIGEQHFPQGSAFFVPVGHHLNLQTDGDENAQLFRAWC